MAFFDHFKQEDLLDLLQAYDNYIGEAARSGILKSGWKPACAEDFYSAEYLSVWKEKQEFASFFDNALDMIATELTPSALALAIDNFYWSFNTYDYKDEIDDREEAISILEQDIISTPGEIKDHLEEELRSHETQDCYHLALGILISQLSEYMTQQQSLLSYAPEPLSKRQDPEFVVLSCYADQVLPKTDDAMLIDSFYSAEFNVPKTWAEEQAKAAGYQSLEEFLDDYTWDTTDGWYLKAFEDGVLEGVTLGNLNSSRTLDKEHNPSRSTMNNAYLPKDVPSGCVWFPISTDKCISVWYAPDRYDGDQLQMKLEQRAQDGSMGAHCEVLIDESYGTADLSKDAILAVLEEIAEDADLKNFSQQALGSLAEDIMDAFGLNRSDLDHKIDAARGQTFSRTNPCGRGKDEPDR